MSRGAVVVVGALSLGVGCLCRGALRRGRQRRRGGLDDPALDGAGDELQPAWLSWDPRVWRTLAMRRIAEEGGDLEGLATTTRQLASLGVRP